VCLVILLAFACWSFDFRYLWLVRFVAFCGSFKMTGQVGKFT
jgi:hypothetical protein